jgi:purine-nucleoside/S-methyl-5'-thioadenosine phosphorylase / adenosine deaminase
VHSTDRQSPITSRAPLPCPVEFFSALDALPFLRAAFIQRCPGIDVVTDRETVLGRLWSIQRETADALGFSGFPFIVAEQVHGNLVARVDGPNPIPLSGADGLVTNRPGLCLAIYVADCAAVYLADREVRAIGLVHAGKKGAELGIVREAIATMRKAFGTDPANLVIQIAPCIRPPNYEVDFAAEIVRQARQTGVRDIFDCGICTASNPEKYYSYRRERGRTGRLLALAAITPQHTKLSPEAGEQKEKPASVMPATNPKI